MIAHNKVWQILHGSQYRPSRSVGVLRGARCPLTRRCAAGGLPEPTEHNDLRAQAKLLSRAFYASERNTQGGNSNGGAGALPPPSDRAKAYSQALQDLPLWRAATGVVSPGSQALLHVVAPHYVHMFDRLFASGPGPWRFGHVYLPGGSRSLGASEWALAAPGSRAPTVGVLMEVSRAVRLMDGKLLVLATAVARIKVLECLQETPYSRARVALLHEQELLEVHHTAALHATLAAAERLPAQTQHPDHPPASSATPVPASSPTQHAGLAMPPAGRLESSSSDMYTQAALRSAPLLAHEAATAATWVWQEYELATARGSAWLESCPVEGRDAAHTRALATDLIDHGVLSILPLPDGPVVGMWDLQALGSEAEAAAAQAMSMAAEDVLQADGTHAAHLVAAGPWRPCARGASPAAHGDCGVMGGQGIQGADSTGMNAASSSTSSNDHIGSGAGRAASGQQQEGQAGGQGTGGDGSAEEEDDGVASVLEAELQASLSGDTIQDLLHLESLVWRELDTLAVLHARVRGHKLGLPLGLLQLRPPEQPPSGPSKLGRPAPGAIGSAAASSAGSGHEGPGGHGGAGAAVPYAEASASEAIVAHNGVAQPHRHAASEGLDVYANPHYPVERRVQRLSYGLAGYFYALDDNDGKQKCLDAPSVLARLSGLLLRARKATRVLAAMAAVRGIKGA